VTCEAALCPTDAMTLKAVGPGGALSAAAANAMHREWPSRGPEHHVDYLDLFERLASLLEPGSQGGRQMLPQDRAEGRAAKVPLADDAHHVLNLGGRRCLLPVVLG
jgi:hypothetical protein